jgi:hypothetical protein
MRELREALFYVNIKWHLVHGEVRRREYHETWIEELAKGGLSLYAVEGLAWCSGLRSSAMKVAAAAHVKF